ncbi:hypothetical protein VTN49DRAFT_4812 [Thermomyces lanuginosus]|uniref:uncharacterized protein n=1 Tax=Thermomyces lanuginosus TaxID=5541 RepID=UPI0037425FF0
MICRAGFPPTSTRRRAYHALLGSSQIGPPTSPRLPQGRAEIAVSCPPLRPFRHMLEEGCPESDVADLVREPP